MPVRLIWTGVPSMVPKNRNRPIRVEQLRRQAALARCEACKAHGAEKRRLIAIAKQYETSAGRVEAARALDADWSAGPWAFPRVARS